MKIKVIHDHQQTTDDLWIALTRDVDLDSKHYSATKLKQTPINWVIHKVSMLKRYNIIKLSLFPQWSTEPIQLTGCQDKFGTG